MAHLFTLKLPLMLPICEGNKSVLVIWPTILSHY